ncbi:hypothetical protein TWF694_001412 [Orbilia ellipsospora]|uniref:Ankyrin repeat protein n=1 Tax=Orbilia ellipsospora TaxID=2528407 RepID=A0AAV9XRZ5_9PEZI
MINEVWGLKKTIKHSDLVLIENEKRKRGRDGKKNVYKVRGRVVKEAEIERKQRRHYFTVLEQHQRKIACLTIEGTNQTSNEIELSTPSPSVQSPLSEIYFGTPGRTMSPSSEIVSRLGEREDRDFGSSIIISGSIRDHLLPSSSEPPQDSFSTLFSNISSIKFDTLFHTQIKAFFQEPTIYTFPFTRNKSTTVYDIFLEPIADINQWAANSISQSLTSLSSTGLFLNFLKSYMILISNNIDEPSIRRRRMDRFIESGLVWNHRTVLEAILEEQQATEIDRLRTLDTDIEHRDHTTTAVCDICDVWVRDHASPLRLIVRSFAVELLYSAARLGNLEIVNLLLDSGFLSFFTEDPSPTNTVCATAMQFAIEYRQDAICILLLQQNTKINTRPISDLSPSLLWTAVMVDAPNLIEELIRYGVRDTWLSCDFESNRWFQYRCHLEETGFSWVRDMDQGVIYKTEIQTALELSVALRRFDCFRILAQAHSARGRNFSSFTGNWGLLHIAAYNRDSTMMKEIIDYFGVQENMDQKRLFSQCGEKILYSALAISIKKRDSSCTQFLLDRGARIARVNPANFGWSDIRSKLEFPRKTGEVSFKESLRQRGLVLVIQKLEKFALQQENEVRFDPLFTDSSDEDRYYDNPYLGFSHKFRYFDPSWVSETFAIYEILYPEVLRKDLSLLYTNTFQLLSHFFESVSLEICTCQVELYPPTQLSLEIKGKLYNEKEALEYIRMFEGGVAELWVSDVVLCKHENGVVIISFPLLDDVRSVRDTIQRLETQYASQIEAGPAVMLIRKMDEFCFERLRSEDENGDEDKGIDARGEFIKHKGSKFISELNNFFSSYKENLHQILSHSLSIPDREFQKELCDMAFKHLEDLDFSQQSSLLRLAIHCDFFDFVASVLQQLPCFKMPKDLVCEATWFANKQTFDMVVDSYIVSEGYQGLEIPLIASIISGQKDKAEKLLWATNIDYYFGGETTLLELATVLGRLEIAKILLEAGASKNIGSAGLCAADKGYFEISTVIRDAMKAIYAKNGASIALRGFGLPSTPSAETVSLGEDSAISSGSILHAENQMEIGESFEKPIGNSLEDKEMTSSGLNLQNEQTEISLEEILRWPPPEEVLDPSVMFFSS